MTTNKGNQTFLLLVPTIALALVAGSCAPIQPTNPAGPRGSGPVYPVLFIEDSVRRETAQAALNRHNQSFGRNGNSEPAVLSPTEVNLNPITATIQSLASGTRGSLYLPKIGTAAVMNEEETRESLRRFIRDWRELIGSDPARLSLVHHLLEPDGSGYADYEQRPFRFPIRGGDYGKLHIRYASDRRVLSLSSSCIPDADRVRTALRALGASGTLSARLTAEEAIKKVRENNVPASEPNATNSNLRVPASAELKPLQLVTYIQPSRARADALEFRIAWEIEVSDPLVKLAYVDSITGEVIALHTEIKVPIRQ